LKCKVHARVLHDRRDGDHCAAGACVLNHPQSCLFMTCMHVLQCLLRHPQTKLCLCRLPGQVASTKVRHWSWELNGKTVYKEGAPAN
jgi:hypothetical protein